MVQVNDNRRNRGWMHSASRPRLDRNWSHLLQKEKEKKEKEKVVHRPYTSP